MSNPYDANRRGRRAATPQPARRRSGSPTIEDYQQLTLAYQKLQEHQQTLVNEVAEMGERFKTQERQLKSAERELAIKTDALRRQDEDIRRVESELIWTRAALDEAEGKGVTEDGQPTVSWPDRYARLQADFENVRKRTEQRLEQEVASSRHQILQDMLPLADHLDLALAHAATIEEDGALQEFVSNIEATRTAFMETLKRYGIQPINAAGQPFDPELHEALGQVNDASVEADHVAQVVQKGYTEGNRLLRPARVLISTGPSGESKAGANASVDASKEQPGATATA